MEKHDETVHGSRLEANKDNVHRIHRIQGQIESLVKMLEADEGSCEDRLIRARTIEKGVRSLIDHLVTCYVDHTLKYKMQEEPEEASAELTRLLKLLNK
jgi:DNA-binding FrmR family transcriptional regulator